MTQRWHERDGGALLDEELAALSAWCRDDLRIDPEARELGHIVVYGTLDADRLGEIDIAVVYPGTFPHTRPAIYQMSGERLDRHQEPLSGNYCLIGRASDQWRPSMKAADLVAGLPDLVAAVDAGGDALAEAEDPQGEPYTSYYPTLALTSILVPESVHDVSVSLIGGRMKVQFVEDPPGLVQAAWDSEPHPCRGVLLELRDDQGNVVLAAPEELAKRFTGTVWEGTWTRIPRDDRPPIDPTQLAADLVSRNPDAARRHGKVHKRRAIDLHALIFDDEVRQGEYAPTVLFLARVLRMERQRPGRFTLESAAVIRGYTYGRRTLGERIRSVGGLGDRVVSAVGLGALGAPLVKLLAQTQTGTMRIADHDIVDPNTTVRWPGGIRHAELPKVDALKWEIEQDHPFVSVEPHRLRVGQAPPPADVLDADPDIDTIGSWLHDADLMVDATAEDNVTRAVCAAAQERGIPQLLVYGVDGYGGVVALLRPGETGCVHCLDLALTEGGHIDPPPAAENKEATRVQPIGCADPTFVAVAPDMLPLVNQAGRVAVAYLTGGDEDGGYGALEGDVFVLAVRQPDGRPLSVPEWRSYHLPPDTRCPACT